MKRRNARRGSVVFLGLMLLAISGCRTFDVRSDWDRGADFERYARFYFFEPPRAEGSNPFADNDLLRKRLRATIVDALEARGFRSVGARGEADFLVTWDVMLEDRIRVSGAASGAVPFHRRRLGLGFSYSTADVRAYQESTLIVDFLSPKDEELVWRGWGTGMLTTRDRDRDPETLERGVRAILDAFPPEVVRD